MDFIQQLDQHVFLTLNGLWTTLSDQCWMLITNRIFWIPLYIFIAYLMLKKTGKHIWFFLLITAVMILLSDQGANLAKRNFQRLRPCHEPKISALVHKPEGCGGQFGFFSGHASNASAISTLVILLFRERLYLILMMSGYTLLVGLSRIFLGAHYPLDIMSGFLWGGLLGYIFYRIYIYSYRKWISGA